ncbi:MAG: methyl-accepting chemotaxis protein [Syntrophobacteraceae bacterium]|nr:methyl-accepting chemotaxis protein [Desulfobacteraceae bacterium]
MRWFHNLKISTKFISVVSIVLILSTVLGAFSIWQLSRVNGSTMDICTNWLPSVRFLGQMQLDMNLYRRLEFQHILSTTSAELDAWEKKMDGALADFKKHSGAFEKLLASDEERRLFDEFQKGLNVYLDEHRKLKDLSRQEKNAEAIAVVRGSSSKAFDNLMEVLDKAAEINGRGAEGAWKTAESIYENSRILIIALLIGSLVIGILLALLVSRIISRALKKGVETAESLARGDLSITIGETSRDETGQLLAAMGTMIESIKALNADAAMLSVAAVEGRLATRADASKHEGDYQKIVQGVNDTLDAVIGPLKVAADYIDRISKGDIPPKITDAYNGDFNHVKNNLNVLIQAMNDVTAVATEIAEGNLTVKVTERSSNDALMQALLKMVSGLTEVVSNIQSVTAQVMSGSQEMSTSAEQVSQGATEQSASVEEVSSSMEQMVANINQNSDNAQQTDKIALKAAADAKEGGKAVAETVSAMKEIAGKISIIEEIARQTNLLALNAAIEAARAGEHGKGFAVVASEVRKLAERSQTAAGEINKLSASSVMIAERAGEMLDRIVPDIQKTADLVQEINAASNEQSSGASQINRAIQQLDQVIQQNASASEEMASTSVELLSQAEQLQKTIDFFRLNQKQSMFALTAATPGLAHAPVAASRGKSAQAAHARHPAPGSSGHLLKHEVSGKGKGKGVHLDLAEKSTTDKEDEEFERY